MNPIVFPNYQNSILNVSNSILKYYGANVTHPTLPYLDNYLTNEYRNIILLLIDGLGVDAIQKHLTKKAIIRKSLKTTITSVFPSTTVAATTSVLSGKAPLETGWFGWHQYFKEADESVVLFTNKAYYHPEIIFDKFISSTYIPYENIYDQIQKANPMINTHEIFPAFRDKDNDTISKLLLSAKRATETEGRNFVYAYWDKVDSLMHEYGPSSNEVHKHVNDVNKAFKEFVNEIDDETLVIAIADHGQVDVDAIDLYEYQDIIDTLIRMPSNESRASVFYVKPDKKEEFEKLFTQYFRNYYVLYRSKEAIEMGLFGSGIQHLKAEEFLGDYIAVATNHFIFNTIKDGFKMKGQHAGLLAEEMLVPLIISTKKSR